MRAPEGAAALLAAALLLAAPSRAGKFDAEEPPEEPAVKLSGLLDLRGYYSDRGVSWLRGGPGPFRYGGRDADADGRGERRVIGAALPQAALVLTALPAPGLRVHVHANFNSDASSGTAKAGVIEAFAAWERELGESLAGVRAGGLIPKVSWEHPDPAWSTRYTLTPSAAGSWIGEELRGYGAEALFVQPLPAEAQVRLTGGGFSGGDRIGRLLWFRGWSLGDYQGDLYPEFTVLGRRYEPLEELDGRLGYYGRGDLRLFGRAVQLGGGYWTNNADDRQGQPGPAGLETQPFRTRFWHYGGQLELGRLTLVSQFLRATVSALQKPAKDWDAVYALGSYEWRRLRVSARWDRFGVLNWAQGHAVTGFLGYSFTPKHQLSAEFVYANQRPVQLERPLARVDRLLQLNWRVRF